MNKIPTSEEFIISKLGINGDIKLNKLECNLQNTIFLMKEFAKLHVEAALKAAAKKEIIKAYYEQWGDEDNLIMDDEDNIEGYYKGPIPTGGKVYTVDKDSILDAYPLDLIK
jgi:hypothetical protein